MKIKQLIILLSVLPFHVSHGDDQIPTDRTITSMHAYDAFVFINFTPSYPSTQGCIHEDSDRRVVIDISNELGKSIYSSALAAAVAQKKVGFGVNACSRERPKLYRIDVKF